MNVEGAHTERLSSFDVDEPLDADSGSEGHAIADPRRTSRTNQSDISARRFAYSSLIYAALIIPIATIV